MFSQVYDFRFSVLNFKGPLHLLSHSSDTLADPLYTMTQPSQSEDLSQASSKYRSYIILATVKVKEVPKYKHYVKKNGYGKVEVNGWLHTWKIYFL